MHSLEVNKHAIVLGIYISNPREVEGEPFEKPLMGLCCGHPDCLVPLPIFPIYSASIIGLCRCPPSCFPNTGPSLQLSI
jgi:hypothetical protein